jgi:hypothetical protein
MKNIIFFFVLAVCVSSVLGEPVKITGDGEAYGHHGDCYGWNACNDAETCALWACQRNGFSDLVAYGESRPCTQFGVCHLFWTSSSVQCQWGNWCDVMGVTDIWCDNGTPELMCRSDLPDQSNPPQLPDEPNGEIPEFSVIGALAVLGLAGLFILNKR